MSEKQTSGIVPVTLSTVNDAALTIASAFADDASTLEALPNPARRANLHRIFAYRLRLTLQNGGVVSATSHHYEGVACWYTYPITFSWVARLRAGVLDLLRYGGLRYVFFRLKERRFYQNLRNLYGPESYVYLALLAVEPRHQGQGHGGALIRHMLDYADSQKLPCYVETQSTKNVNMYARFGFKLIKSTCFPPDSDCKVYIMLREPQG